MWKYSTTNLTFLSVFNFCSNLCTFSAGRKKWKLLSFTVAVPGVALCWVNAYLKEKEHHEHFHRPEFQVYDHLRLRTKVYWALTVWVIKNHKVSKTASITLIMSYVHVCMYLYICVCVCVCVCVYIWHDILLSTVNYYYHHICSTEPLLWVRIKTSPTPRGCPMQFTKIHTWFVFFLN